MGASGGHYFDIVTIFKEHTFPAAQVRSLCWRGDELVDWVGGGRSFDLEGAERPRHVNYAYRFDGAIASPDGRFAVIYEKLGTKGLLLDNGKIVRELDRSFYCANAYEFPVTLFNDASGRLLLAHCPRRYCGIELEEVETGRALTASEARKPTDFFHSRLSASPSGRRLLSAGWVWHPWNAVVCFDVEQGLIAPHQLDRGESLSPQSGYEESSACWLDDDTLIIGSSADEENLGDEPGPDDEPILRPKGLAIYDVAHRICKRAFQLREPAGTIFPIGRGHILSLYRHPKLIDLASGTVLHVWDGLDSGLQGGSIIWGLKENEKPPPTAFDAIGRRFAIANRDAITVIEFPIANAGKE